jgi:hypothetical protein
LLYLIGGPARSGKSLLARRLLQMCQAPYFCTDYLTSGLAVGAPELKVGHELGNQLRGERIWPVLVGVLRNLVEVEPEYVVEGDALLPGRIASLRAEYPGRLRACFVGYPRCSVEAKVWSVRTHLSPVNDWVGGMPEDHLHELVVEMAEFSRYLEAECRLHGIAFFDGSVDFELALRQAEGYLVGGAVGLPPAGGDGTTMT